MGRVRNASSKNWALTMVTKTELLEVIENGENSGVDFKRDELATHQLAETLVAFSNSEGGMVLLGVEDDGTIRGIARDNLEEWVMTACRDKIRPGIVPYPYYETIRNVEPDKDVAVVRVLRGLDVNSQWHNNTNTYFIRVGSVSREPTPQELSRLFQQRGMVRADLRPMSGTKIEDLDRRRLKDYFSRIRQQDVPDDDDDSGWRALLVNTEIMVEEVVSLSGLLLFGKTPKRFLPQSGVEAAAFQGLEKDYSIKDQSSINGPLTPLMDQRGEVLETGVIDRSLEFVRRNTKIEGYIEENGRRAKRREYPTEAVREALVNALIHRDYLLGHTDVELSIYANRLEIISPGKLPNGITPERMRAGTRAARNQLLKDIMRDYGYLEHLGMGVPRIIVRGMKEHNQTDPDLVEENERFIVRLHSR